MTVVVSAREQALVDVQGREGVSEFDHYGRVTDLDGFVLQALVDVQGREGVRAMLPSMGEFRFIVLAMHTQVPCLLLYYSQA